MASLRPTYDSQCWVLLYSSSTSYSTQGSHYSTQEVAGVTEISSWKESQEKDNLMTITGHLCTPVLLSRPRLRNWLILFLYTTVELGYNETSAML